MHLDTPDAPDLFEFTDVVKPDGPMIEPHVPAWDDTACILYTGGTTGVSKGVQLTHGNLSANVQQTDAWFPHFKLGEEIVVGCLPFFHSFGMTSAMNAAIFSGYGNILIPKPEPKAILDAIVKSKATFIPAVPTLYNGMINFPDLKDYDISSLRGCFSGGASLPMETIKSFEKIDRNHYLRGVRAYRIFADHTCESVRNYDETRNHRLASFQHGGEARRRR